MEHCFIKASVWLNWCTTKYCIIWLPFSILKSYKLYRQHNAPHIKTGFLPHFHTSKLNLILHVSSGNTVVTTHNFLPKQWGFCSEGSPYTARQTKATRNTQYVCSTAATQPFLRCWKQKDALFRQVVALPKLCIATDVLLPALGPASQPHRFWGSPQCRAIIHPLMDTPLCGFSPQQPLPPVNPLSSPSFFPAASHVLLLLTELLFLHGNS